MNEADRTRRDKLNRLVMRKFSGLEIACLCTLSLCSVQLHAQAVGTIIGTVTDPSGALVAGAKVAATQQETGLARSTESTDAGTYSLPLLPVGTYLITAEHSGFRSASVSGVTLDVSQRRAVNFKLAIAGSTISVQVDTTPPLLQTESGTLEGLVTGQQAATLPLNGRNILNLVLLQPGMNVETNSTFVYNEPIFAGNGNRGPATAVSLDGVDASDAEFGGVQFSNLNPDAIQEFKVLQNSYSAEYGQGAGTVVQLVSKAGTNRFHGSLFEFVRNNIFDATNYFATSVPPFQRNEFGGTIGGPVIIPKLYNGHDHTFFFFEYAGFRQRSGEPTVVPVPTPQERNGIVPITGANGQPDTLIVPLDPVAKQVLSLYPLPNDPSGPYGANTLNVNFKVPENHDQYSIRTDHVFNDRDSIFGRFTYIKNENLADNPFVAIENPGFSTVLRNNPMNFGLSETHAFSAHLLNEAKFGMNRFYIRQAPLILNIPQTQFSDGSLNQFGPDTSNIGYTTTTFTAHDGLHWTRGRHAYAFGGEYRLALDDGFGASNSGPNGFFTFSPGVPTNTAIPSSSGQNDIPAGTPSPSSLISFMLGQPSSYGRSTAMPGFGNPDGSFKPWRMRRFYISAWIQDDIQVTRKVTANLGFRYEYNSVPYELDNRFAAIIDDPRFGPPGVFRHTVVNPEPLYRPDYKGFGPRVGLAYKVASKTVFRGGFAMFTNMPPNNFADQASFNFPFAAFSSRPNPPYSLTPLPSNAIPLTDLNGNVLPPNNQTKLIPPNTAVLLAPEATALGGQIETNLTTVNLRNGYTLAGNVTVQQELPGALALQVAYVANNAVELYAPSVPNGYTGALPQYAPYSALDPGLGEFILLDNHGHSTYNALQATLRKVTPSKGITFQASYTYSRAIDNASTVFDALFGGVGNSAEMLNNPLCTKCERGVSSFDFPQRFVVNFQYQLPLDKVEMLHAVPSRVKAGWGMSAIISAQSGYPFTVTSPYGTVQFGTDTFYAYQPTRPDLLQSVTYNARKQPQLFSDAVTLDGQALSQQYFATPTSGGLQTHPGDLGRNTFRTRGFSNADFSLTKNTKITESTALEFRAESFNLLNQHAFAIPPSVLGSPGFGIANATVLPERQIQFAARFLF